MGVKTGNKRKRGCVKGKDQEVEEELNKMRGKGEGKKNKQTMG